jgi:hypothetical protein
VEPESFAIGSFGDDEEEEFILYINYKIKNNGKSV